MFKKILKIIKFFYFKLLRSKETPHSIALAVAIGVFVGCFIPPGAHTVTVLLLAFLLRTDKIIAFAATWIANPYTVPFLYPAFCYLGSKILCTGHSFHDIEMILLNTLHSFSWDNIRGIGEELVFSFLIGGFIFGIVLGVISYFITYNLMIAHRKRKNEKRILKAKGVIE